REGSYRGKKSVDAKFSIKQKLAYTCKCDEATYENLKLALMGEDAGNNARNALVEAAADVMPFTVGSPSDLRRWYDVLIAGVQQTHLAGALVFFGTPENATTQDTGDTFTDNGHGLANGDRVILVTLTTTTGASLLTPYHVVGAAENTFQLSATAGGSALTLTTNGSATYLAAKVEDSDYGFDPDMGRIKPLVAITTNLYAFISGEQITTASPTYRKSFTPLEQASVEGYARLAMFSAGDEQLTWEHRDFSCSVTVQNFTESNGKTPAMFDVMLTVTHDRGTYFAPDEAAN
ncbi:MAG TPA: hypothetical protein PKA41_17360, partial [Verrucomicrobiota bacterium]|nr:hypothetical protein [Verrucomicrobiota bacterium]